MIEFQHRAGKLDRVWISRANDACALLSGGLGDTVSDRFVGILGRELLNRGGAKNPDTLVRTILRINKEILNDHEWGFASADILAMRRDQLFAVHVGNSRIYHVRRDQLRQVSTDHSWVAEQVKAGTLDEQTSRTHELGKVMTRALPSKELIPEVIQTEITAGDRVIICTREAWSAVDDPRLLRADGTLTSLIIATIG